MVDAIALFLFAFSSVFFFSLSFLSSSSHRNKFRLHSLLHGNRRRARTQRVNFDRRAYGMRNFNANSMRSTLIFHNQMISTERMNERTNERVSKRANTYRALRGVFYHSCFVLLIFFYLISVVSALALLLLLLFHINIMLYYMYSE